MKLVLLVVLLALIVTINANFLNRKCECKAVSDLLYYPYNSWDISSCKLCGCDNAAITNCESACRAMVENYAKTGCGKLPKNTKVKYSYEASTCKSVSIISWASARNLCQHSDNDGIQCTSDDYIHCPHCQLQLCLKHLNFHQDLIRSDFYLLCNDINNVCYNLDNLIFDSTNHRENLFVKLNHWYDNRINVLNQIYFDKKQELQILCLQAQIEFDTYKTKKDKQLKENLLKQLKKISKQKQIHFEDLNQMKEKLNDIQTGLDELKQLLIDIHYDQTTMDIQIIKRRYVEAAKSSFNEDDEDDNLWDTDDEDEESKTIEDIPLGIELSSPMNQQSSTPDIILLSPPSSCSSSTTVRKAPLKFIIKRLKQPTTSTKVKYKLHTITTPPSPLVI